MISTIRTLPLFCLLLSVIAGPVIGQQYRPSYEKVVLQNGMQVIFHRDTTTPRVSLALSFHAGSSRDPKGKTGLASLAGSLLLATSGDIPTQQYVRLQSEARATTTGMTNVDWTTISSSCDMSYLETALWIESARLKSGAGQITAQMVTMAVQRVLEKRRQARSDPLSDFQETVFSELYPKGYPYHHVTAGDTSDLKKLQVADVRKFITLYFVPANATLTIGGNFPVDDALRMVRRHFEPLPGGKRPQWDKKKTTLPTPGFSSLILQDAVDASQLHFVFPGAPVTERDDPTLSLVAEILAGASTARLMTALSSFGTNILSVQARHSAQELDGAFWISINCKMETNLQPVYEQVMSTIRELSSRECADEELLMARNQYEMKFLAALERHDGFGARCDLLNLGNLYTDNPAHFFAYPERMRNTTRFAVMDAARSYLAPSSVLIVSVVPPGKKHLAAAAK